MADKIKKLLFLLIIILVLGITFNVVNDNFKNFVRAAGEPGSDFFDPTNGDYGLGENAVKTTSPKTDRSILKGFATDVKNFFTGFNWEKAQAALQQAAASAYKSALRNFLNSFAMDTATWLASGDKGQQPMFVTEGWGKYLTNAADNAAGTFIETLGKSSTSFVDQTCLNECIAMGEENCPSQCTYSSGLPQFNLCSPSSDLVQAKINLGLMQTAQPAKPSCTFSKMVKSWDEAIQSQDFLKDFQDMFNPWSNDVGIALTLQSQMIQTSNKAYSEKLAERMSDEGFRPVAALISGDQKTPSYLTRAMAQKALADSNQDMMTFTGNAAADAIDIFINTLLGKLIDRFKNGLVSDTSKYDSSYDWSKLSYNSQGKSAGIAGAKDRFAKLTQPNFKSNADVDILGKLTNCPDPNNAGPTDCVITENFRQAIAQKLSVGEAFRTGYLADGIFGFTADGLEPTYNEAYPYRTMIILRKYRIIPVGWELAAQYIKDHPNVGTRKLGDLIACFDHNDIHQGYNDDGSQTWCEGLVDPTWTLKSPQNYCKKEGPGPQIASDTITGQGENSKRSIVRKSDYCADEQSCVKEDENGKCIYGYCTNEKRVWNFNNKSCQDPNYNTCETFKKTGGNTISYLKNTLDYGDCTADNVGCKGYCQAYDYANLTFTCDNTDADKIYLDKDANECDNGDEGCHEFIRTNPGVGANLLPNSSFEEALANGGWDLAGTQSDEGFDKSHSLNLNSGSLNKNVTIGLANYNIAGEIFSLSFYAKNCGVNGQFAISDGGGHLATSSLISAADTWNSFFVTYTFPPNISVNTVNLSITNADPACLIDAIKLSRGDAATVYSGYGASGVIYEKLLPAYLESACYEAGSHRFIDTDNNGQPDNPACAKYARECEVEEVGCELYRSASDDFSVPAKVISTDYCPAECVGYDKYLQSDSSFDSQRSANFVPSRAKICSASASGCDEFTNLDKLGEGAEAVEYYSQLRQCMKPDDAQCAEFYTWEGSAETGYQLRVFSLQAQAGDPFTYYDGPAACDAASYNLDANPMCREFYNKTGNISYRFYQYTVSCSDNCHPYRRTENNIVVDPVSGYNLPQAQCEALTADASRIHYDNTSGVCYFCKNNGVWNDQHNACIYMAIPGEGQKCEAGQAGCREYTGNAGSNMRQIYEDDFRSGSLNGWSGDMDLSQNPSSESMNSSDLSLFASGNNTAVIRKNFSGLVEAGKSYSLSFIAKSTSNININVRFENGAGARAEFSTGVAVSSDWDIFELNLTAIDHDIDSGESLVITGSGSGQAAYYLDYIVLTEITDHYFLIKNAFNTPDSCLQDINGNPDPDWNLGCDKYKDRAGKTHYLKSFDWLCQESAVGCELMIDTHNSANPGAETFTNGSTVTTVPADSYIYAVYDKTKKCNQADKGCQYLGDAYSYEDNISWQGVYLKNNPDAYGRILCGGDEVDCQSWISGDGANYYFKDPKDQVCEWRQAAGQGDDGWQWLKKKTKRCDDGANGGTVNGRIDTSGSGVGATPLEDNICQTDDNCRISASSTHFACIADDNDYECPTSDMKTISQNGRAIDTPALGAGGYNWAGICPASESGCSEYIDPKSQFSANLLFNPDFTQNVDGYAGPDGWENGVQDLVLEANYLYRLAGKKAGVAGTLVLNCPGAALYELNSANNFGAVADTINLVLSAADLKSTLFLNKTTASTIPCTLTMPTATGGDLAEIKKAIVMHQLDKDIDKTECNGIMDFEKGCILFNERVQNGAGLTSLNWNADLTDSGETPDAVTAPFNANSLIKVTPDRACDTWLGCRSYVKDGDGNNTCYDIGLCSGLDENNICNSFVSTDQANQFYDTGAGVSSALSKAQINNMSGYTKIGYSATNSLSADLFPFSAMEQEGESAVVTNGNFELYNANEYPYGWSLSNNASWDSSKFRAVNDPIQAQAEGISYKAEGSSFLKYAPVNQIESELIDVMPNTTYNFSALLNTKSFRPGAGYTNTIAQIVILTFDATGASTAYPGGSIDITECDGTADNHPWINGCAIISNQGLDWHKAERTFKTGPLTSRIKLVLMGAVYWDTGECISRARAAGHNVSNCIFNIAPYNIPCAPSNGCSVTPDPLNPVTDGCGWGPSKVMTKDACSGNVFVDDIKITPALEMKSIGRTYLYSPQTCRLYPEKDALSCEYYEDNGKRMRGWYGYCLEHDRKPGNEDTCLLWWPVDRVKNDGIDEGAGYNDRYPLYYCTGNNFYEVDLSVTHNAGTCPGAALTTDFCSHAEGFGSGVNFTRQEFINVDPRWASYLNRSYITSIRVSGVIGGGGGTCDGDILNAGCCTGPQGDIFMQRASATFDSNNNFNHAYAQVADWSHDGCESSHSNDLNVTMHLRIPYCSQLVQTVTPMGQNKYWSGRVYEGTNYSFPCRDANGIGQTCSYTSDYNPFGSIVAGTPSTNPSEWDSKTEAGIQPLFFEAASTGDIRAGQLHYIDQIQRLFAQSYGIWNWDAVNSRYVIGTGIWTPPSTVCAGNQRPVYDGSGTDLCAVRPLVQNIKVNNGFNFSTNGNQFVNLTFNSRIDSNQLPMVMYGIDWGDNEKTVVSGVEMRDKSDINNPHSFYHLYDYWDLRSKWAVNQDPANVIYNTVYCGDAGAPATNQFNIIQPSSGVSCGPKACCKVKPGAVVKDNWGCYSNPALGTNCLDGPSAYTKLSGWVTVDEP